MTVRTTSKTATFMHPFNLNGTDKMQPAGTYTVETDEELLQTSSFRAYRDFNADATTGAKHWYDVDSDRRNKSGGAREGPSERRTAGRNDAATGAQRSYHASEKGGWPDGILPCRLETLGYPQRQ